MYIKTDRDIMMEYMLEDYRLNVDVLKTDVRLDRYRHRHLLADEN